MDCCKANSVLPFHVRRIIAHYRPQLRESIAHAIVAKADSLRSAGRELTCEDISECVGSVVGELSAGAKNQRMETLSWEAYQQGEYQPLQEVIDELRSSIAASASI